MPIYEYECENPDNACDKCAGRFEVIQRMSDAPISECPWCGQRVLKLISHCRSAIVETTEGHSATKKRIRDYEKKGMWSHAAELADTHSQMTNDKKMKMRAIDNYQKAGHDNGMLERYAKKENS